jgi:hypothetical protein
MWVLKRFWFPILIAILGSLADRSPALKKIHTALKKFK